MAVYLNKTMQTKQMQRKHHTHIQIETIFNQGLYVVVEGSLAKNVQHVYEF